MPYFYDVKHVISDDVVSMMQVDANEFLSEKERIKSPVAVGFRDMHTDDHSQMNNHTPAVGDFLGYKWMMVHGIYATSHDLMPETQSDLCSQQHHGGRVFEFLQNEISTYVSINHKKSLIEACRRSYAKLLQMVIYDMFLYERKLERYGEGVV